MSDWRTPAADLTDAELIAAWNETSAAFDRARDDEEGHGGSPGEWAYERCLELEGQFMRRGIPIPGPQS